MDYTIADRLTELRRVHGYSQESLAAELGLTRQAVSRWERGESLPDTENLIALADLYGVSLDELVRPSNDASSVPEKEVSEEALVPEMLEPEGAEHEPDVPPVPPAPQNLSAEAPMSISTSLGESVQGESRTHRAGGYVAKVLLGCLIVVVSFVLLTAGGCVLLRFNIATGPVEERRALSDATDASAEVPGHVSDAYEASTNEVHIDAGQVDSLHIEWALGPVEVVVMDDATGEEDSPGILVAEEYLDTEAAQWPMYVDVENGELEVRYARVGTSGTYTGEGKRLTVRAPQNLASTLRSVECDIASGSLEMSGLACQELDLDLASGSMDIAGIEAQKLSADVTSGNVKVEGRFIGEADMNLASGELLVSSDVVPTKTEIDVASGNAVLELPTDASFKVNVDRSSGTFELNFEATQSGDVYTVGNGDSIVTVDIDSGSVRICER